MHGRAPYDEVLTHGFTVDAQGRKMSKSLGNVIAPQKVVDTLGADVLRLWVTSTDYRNEIAVSDEILKRVSDAYRRIRNTSRFLLGNLDGFDPARDLLPTSECLLLDRWAEQQAHDVQQAVVAAYARHDFPEVVARIQNFCTNEMGALYLDITKDRLYTMPTASRGRQSAQSAMYRIIEAMVRWLAPLVSFTAEEIWQHMPGARGESVLFETWYGDLASTEGAPVQRRFWSDLLAIREVAAKQMEIMRANREIGASLDAEVTLHLDAKTRAELEPYAEELRFFFIVSDLTIDDDASAPAEAAPVDSLHDENRFASVVVRRSANPKCIRCWHHRADVGVDPAHPEICGRCVANVEGPGESRKWF
jgi:isoleucyl-tRNA synthetase